MQEMFTLFMSLLREYGPTGVAFGLLVFMIFNRSKASDKRISDLENAQQEQYKLNIETHKQMINDYVELVRNKTQVLVDLTGCLKAIKETLERLERKQN